MYAEVQRTPGPPLVVTTHDARRLEALLENEHARRSPMAAPLEAELMRARLVDPTAVGADVVTMNSRVLCLDESSGEQHDVELVYPHDADAARGRVSVLAPMGAALLGLSVGALIEWPLPAGRMARVRVTQVLYQPEAVGRLD